MILNDTTLLLIRRELAFILKSKFFKVQLTTVVLCNKVGQQTTGRVENSCGTTVT